MPFPSASYGICYTFNSARNTEDSNVPRKSSLTGSANGLTIEIFVDQVLVQSGCEEGIVNFLPSAEPKVYKSLFFVAASHFVEIDICRTLIPLVLGFHGFLDFVDFWTRIFGLGFLD